MHMIDLYDNDNILTILKKAQDLDSILVCYGNSSVQGKVDFISSNLLAVNEPTNRFDMKTNKEIFNKVIINVEKITSISIKNSL